MSNTGSIRRVLREIGIPPEHWPYFQAIIYREIDPYKSVNLQKKSARSSRAISIPDPSLKKVQSEILLLLEKEIPSYMQSNSFAYTKGKSHAEAAEIHLGMAWGVKVDIAKFFDHVTETHVRKALVRAGFGDKSEVLAKLCTRVELDWPNGLPPKYSRYRRAIGHYDLRSGTAKFFRNALREYPFLVNRANRGQKGLRRNGQEQLIVMPPKRIPRLYPISGSRYANPKRDQIWSIFRRKTRKYVHRDELPDFPNGQSRTYWHEEVTFSRWSLRKKILDFYSNPSKFSKLIGSSIHRFYPVAPSQFRLRFRDGRLPQGAPTSGFLSNLVMRSFDKLLQDYCHEHNLRYTRYSDDVVVSSLSSTFSREYALQIVSFIQKVCEFNGFTLNKDKTRVMTPGSRKFILGLMVDGDKLRLGRHDREAIELAIYKYSKFGESWEANPNGRHELNGVRIENSKRLGTHDFPNVASPPKASLFGWLAYCKRVDVDFLERIYRNLSKGRWSFIDEGDFEELFDFISALLEKDAESSKSAIISSFIWKEIPQIPQ
jgi:hypothetical protein